MKCSDMFYIIHCWWNSSIDCRKTPPWLRYVGYIDVGDGCWWRNVLVTSWRCWWPIWYIEKRQRNEKRLQHNYSATTILNRSSSKSHQHNFVTNITVGTAGQKGSLNVTPSLWNVYYKARSNIQNKRNYVSVRNGLRFKIHLISCEVHTMNRQYILS